MVTKKTCCSKALIVDTSSHALTVDTSCHDLSIPDPHHELAIIDKHTDLMVADTTNQTTQATSITAHFDCGFQNTLFIRGEGVSTLSWDKGIPMKNIGPDRWVWESNRPFSIIQYKILINDSWFEQGNNHKVAFGQSVLISPSF